MSDTTEITAQKPQAERIVQSKRVFLYGPATLEDPDAAMTEKEVLEFYSGQFTELMNFTITGPLYNGETREYTFTKEVGDKG